MSHRRNEDPLTIEGDYERQKQIVQERWNRLKKGDAGFMGYANNKKTIFQFIKSLFKKS